MKFKSLFTSALLSVLWGTAALWMFSASAHAAGSCAGTSVCAETSTFVAALSDFRTSVAGTNRVLTATVRLENRTDRPLILGYVQGSGVALDEHGNRYTVSGSRDVRGIGEIQRNTFDPKFTLQPGERSDARFDLRWYAGRSIVGVKFDLELTLREIDEVTGNQHRLGKEHALRFASLNDGLRNDASANAPATAVAAAAAPAPSATAATFADPCAGNARCYATGPFVAEIMQLASGQKQSNAHVVRIGVRLRNVSNQPLILAYQQNSGTMLDNYGQRYTVDWRSNANVSGIGQSTRQKADPQFVLSPGEARTAVFNYSRYVGKTAIGTVFSPDLVIEQLEILPSQQIRSVRDYSVSFANITAASNAVSGVGDAAQSINDAGRQLSEGLKSIFRKKN